MKRIFGLLALVLLFSGMSVLPGCTMNLNSSGLSINYTAPTTEDLLKDCNSHDILWMKAYKNMTVLGVQVVSNTAYAEFYGWNGDQCTVDLITSQKKFYCKYSRAELNQSGVDVLKTIATRCGFASEGDRLCVGSGSGTMGSFLDTGESCTGG